MITQEQGITKIKHKGRAWTNIEKKSYETQPRKTSTLKRTKQQQETDKRGEHGQTLKKKAYETQTRKTSALKKTKIQQQTDERDEHVQTLKKSIRNSNKKDKHI